MAADLITVNGRPVRRGSACCWWNLAGRQPVMVVAADQPNGRQVVLDRSATIIEAQEILDRVNGGLPVPDCKPAGPAV